MTQAQDNLSPLDPGQPHKPADDDEKVFFEGSPMLRGDFSRVAGMAIVCAALIAAPILWYTFFRDTFRWWYWVVGLGLAALCIIIPLLLVKATRYRITNYRIDYERGILSKRIDTMELWHVDDVNFHQSLLDRIFNVGDITVISDDQTTPKLELRGIPNARPLFDTLKQRIIAVKRQRGVIKMDSGN
jgi:membrane protein YdbS with pleckstrin-like domain